LKRLRDVQADVALDFQGNIKGAMHAWLSGAPRRIGFARGHCYEGAHRFATETVTPPSPRIPRAEKFLSLLGPLGVKDPAPRALPPLPPRRIEGPYVLLHPGTSAHGAEKRWAPDRWTDLARRIKLPVYFSAGPDEGDFGERTVRPSSLLELAALARDAKLFVGCDSGPLHLAAAVGTRCVGLYGPKDPAIYGPYPADGHIVVAPPTPRPMDWLDVETAVAAVERAL
jgi:ADP-heptose:LPS heptosyltransferase